MRTLLQSNDAEDFRLLSGRLKPLRIALTGDHTIDADGPIGHFLDPGVTPRVVTLPLVDEGLFYFVSNEGAANLTVKNASGVTIQVLSTGIATIFYTDGQSWRTALPTVSYNVFGAVGASHSIGLVPDPGPVAGTTRFLGDDAQWHGAASGSLLDGYSFITDGTNTAAGTGNDTFRLRTSAKLSVVVTDNDVTFGDNALFDVVEAQINHNALLNYVADQHVAHSSVSITGTNGISGGGTIAASCSLSLDFAGLSSASAVIGDTVAYVHSGTHFRTTLTQINGILVHNNLSGYVANQHVDHSAVSISAGTGLSGGGDITASRTLNLNVTGLSTLGEALAAGDEFPVYNVSASAHAKVTFGTINSTLDHDVLTNFVANKHIDHSTVSITAGNGLTGGGNITATRSLAIDAASTTDALTGTSTAKVVTPDALAALWEKGADVASAATVSLGEGGFFHITGTTTITDIDFATPKDGRWAMVTFDGALTLTHNSTTLKLPNNGANITTAAGDRACFVQDSGDNVICLWYQKADGTALQGGGGVSDGDKGDITVSSSGTVWTVDNDVVTFAKMQNISTDRLIGRDTAATGDPEEISVTNGLAFTGSSGIGISNGGVTYARIQDVSATSRILARKTAGAGSVEECTIADVLNFIASNAQGDIIIRDASGFTRLAAGTSGQFLKTQGAGANPIWADVATGWTQVNKTSDTTRSATTTTSADPALQFSMAASTNYQIKITVFITTTAAGDFKYGESGPASPTAVFGGHSQNNIGFSAYQTNVALVSTGTDLFLIVYLAVQNGANAGTFSFDWAQNTSDAGNTIVRKGSYLEYRTF